MMRKACDYLVLPLLACGLGYGAYELTQLRTGSRQQGSLDEAPPKRSQNYPYKGEPVALNRGPEIADGFRGGVHPLLHGQTKLELTAHWVPFGNGRFNSEMLVPDVCNIFLELKPAAKQRTYTERDFSAFLPEKLAAAGQVWSLDPNKVANMLRQFHDSPSMHLTAIGRRVGPDGAFAVLRAVSPSYLDIAFRIHAEFDVSPKQSAHLGQFCYTPSYFSGQMIVNRETGTVEYFRLGLPTDKTLNAHFTHNSTKLGDGHEIVRVDRMELLGGNSELAAKDIAWEESISYDAAHQQLQRVFYKFMEINWLPFDQIMAAARHENKPILAMVLWGALDDQSC